MGSHEIPWRSCESSLKLLSESLLWACDSHPHLVKSQAVRVETSVESCWIRLNPNLWWLNSQFSGVQSLARSTSFDCLILLPLPCGFATRVQKGRATAHKHRKRFVHVLGRPRPWNRREMESHWRVSGNSGEMDNQHSLTTIIQKWNVPEMVFLNLYNLYRLNLYF